MYLRGDRLSTLQEGSLQALYMVIWLSRGIRKAEIQGILGWKKDRVDHSLRKLRRLGMVKVESLKDEGRGGGVNSYSIEDSA